MALFEVEVDLDVQVEADDPDLAREQVRAALKRTFEHMNLSNSKPEHARYRVQHVHCGGCPGHPIDILGMNVGPAIHDLPRPAVADKPWTS